MKKMWARVGMSFEFTDDEYKKFIKEISKNAGENMIQNLIESGKATLDGETYFPEQGCFGDDTTDNLPVEINLLF